MYGARRNGHRAGSRDAEWGRGPPVTCRSGRRRRDRGDPPNLWRAQAARPTWLTVIERTACPHDSSATTGLGPAVPLPPGLAHPVGSGCCSSDWDDDCSAISGTRATDKDGRDRRPVRGDRFGRGRLLEFLDSPEEDKDRCRRSRTRLARRWAGAQPGQARLRHLDEGARKRGVSFAAIGPPGLRDLRRTGPSAAAQTSAAPKKPISGTGFESIGGYGGPRRRERSPGTLVGTSVGT